jgi:hypothetical protein
MGSARRRETQVFDVQAPVFVWMLTSLLCRALRLLDLESPALLLSRTEDLELSVCRPRRYHLTAERHAAW